MRKNLKKKLNGVFNSKNSSVKSDMTLSIIYNLEAFIDLNKDTELTFIYESDDDIEKTVLLGRSYGFDRSLYYYINNNLNSFPL